VDLIWHKTYRPHSKVEAGSAGEVFFINCQHSWTRTPHHGREWRVGIRISALDRMKQHRSLAGYGTKGQITMAKQASAARIKTETPRGVVLSADMSAATSLTPCGAYEARQFVGTIGFIGHQNAHGVGAHKCAESDDSFLHKRGGILLLASASRRGYTRDRLSRHTGEFHSRAGTRHRGDVRTIGR
jgi:hypothetical protein